MTSYTKFEKNHRNRNYDQGYEICQTKINPTQADAGQLRFSIEPTPENFSKTLKVLRELYKNEALRLKEIEFKLLSLKNKPVSNLGWDIANLNYDSPLLGNPAPTDRDQRGKELCIYIPESLQNKKSVAFWKKLILTVWVALEKEGVTLDYVSTPLGDNPLTQKPGLSIPVTHTRGCPNDYKGRYGILFKTNQPSVLDNVRITEKDLKKYGITVKTSASRQTRNNNLCKHRDDLEQAIRSQIKSLTENNAAPFSALLLQFKNHITPWRQLSANELQTALHSEKTQQYIQTLQRKLPKEGPRLAVNAYLAQLTHLKSKSSLKKDGATPLDADKQQALLTMNNIIASPAKEINLIIKDYIDYADQLKLKTFFSTSSQQTYPSVISTLVNKNPAQMQWLFRRLVFLAHETKNVIREKDSLHSFIKKEQKTPGQKSAWLIKDYLFSLKCADKKRQEKALARAVKKIKLPELAQTFQSAEKDRAFAKNDVETARNNIYTKYYSNQNSSRKKGIVTIAVLGLLFPPSLLLSIPIALISRRIKTKKNELLEKCRVKKTSATTFQTVKSTYAQLLAETDSLTIPKKEQNVNTHPTASYSNNGKTEKQESIIHPNGELKAFFDTRSGYALMTSSQAKRFHKAEIQSQNLSKIAGINKQG
jgi:hypothetical protein